MAVFCASCAEFLGCEYGFVQSTGMEYKIWVQLFLESGGCKIPFHYYSVRNSTWPLLVSSPADLGPVVILGRYLRVQHVCPSFV
jgi:hypothetical protein